MVLFYRYLSRISPWSGFLLFAKFHWLKKQWNVKVPFLANPVFLRKGTSDLATFDQVFLTGIYKLPVDFNPSVIIDCGANVGMASVYFANRYPKAKIISIEPDPSNFEVLQMNGKGYSNITLLKKAVWHTTGSLHIIDPGKGQYALQVSDQVNTSHKIVATIEAVTLNDLLVDYNLESIDFIKIDIEGSERFVFSENAEWLSRTKALSVEIHESISPGTSKTVVKALAQYDFSIQGSFEGYLCFKD